MINTKISSLFFILVAFLFCTNCGPVSVQVTPADSGVRVVSDGGCAEGSVPTPNTRITEDSMYLNVFATTDNASEAYQLLVFDIESTALLDFSFREPRENTYAPVIFINDVPQKSVVHNGKAIGLWFLDEVGRSATDYCNARFYQLTMGFANLGGNNELAGQLLSSGRVIRLRVDLCSTLDIGRCFRGEERQFTVIIR
jgi:hypothetical protein